MKKITFFLSLLLTVVGITTTQAQNTTTPEKTLLEPSDLKDGRVITLKACDGSNSRYMKFYAVGSETFNPRETVLVIEEVEEIPQEISEESNEEKTFFFYLKNFSDNTYLKKPSEDNVPVASTEKIGEAAVFHAVKVSTGGDGETKLASNNFSGGVTENDVIRFVTTTTEDVTLYLNSNGSGQPPRYYTGGGTLGVFCVYDAAELCYKEYGKNLGEQPVYVGDPIHSEIQEQAMYAAFQDYDGSPSEDNYNAVLAAAESDKGKFDPNLYYLIENNHYSNHYMEVTKDNAEPTPKNVLICSNNISGSASQIWRFEPAGTDSETNDKYYMTSQGVYCSEPSTENQVELSETEREKASFYMIEVSTGVYAFDSGYNEILGKDANKGKGLQEAPTNKVIGWGTAAGSSKWKLKYVDAYDLVVSTAGWASLNLPFAVNLPDGLTAYYATGTTGEGLEKAIVLEEAGPQIPANFPVVIAYDTENMEDETKTYSLTILPAEPKIESPASDGNKFKGTLLPAIPENPGFVYALGLWKGVVYFCKLNTEGSAGEDGNTATPEETSTIAANKAYYDATSDGDDVGVNALRFSFGTATGIAGASASAPSAGRMWFDLKGRRVLYPGKGIYVNAAGEKVLFK